MELTELMDELFRRAAASDAEGVAAMCADGCAVKQNIGDEGGVDELVAIIRGLADADVTTRYSDIRRVVADHAVTEQHLVTLTRADGVEVSADVCVVVHFDDEGKVVRLDEYLDGAALGPIFA